MSKNDIDLSVFCMSARGLISQGKIEDAIGIYSDVIQIDPENSLAYADRGTAYAMMKNFDLAIIDLKRAFSLGYADVSAYSTMATIYSEKKQLQNALEYFAKAIELNKNYPLTYYNRSNVFYEIGDHESAISDLNKCLEFKSDENFRELVIRRLNMLSA